ncbi:MAG: surfactin synthetase, partial [Cohnella sp.]|nr:surfactin synthetase [Cohnella sp.]
RVMPIPKDHETGDHRMRNTRTVEFGLTASETERLTTRVHQAYHTEMNDILLTALGLAMREWCGDHKILVNLEGHGREEIIEGMNLSRTVGWFTTQYPVVLELPYGTDPGYQIKRVKEDLRHIPHKGIGYGLLRYLTDDRHKSGLSFSLAPEISFNYLGQFAETAMAGLFQRSPLSIGNPLSPDTERMHPIDIVGAIEDGVLNMTITYNSLVFEEQSIVRLRNRFKTELLDLMEHCLTQEGRELTPSDLGDDELTLEELDSLQEIL